jgi:hypothetical protein
VSWGWGAIVLFILAKIGGKGGGGTQIIWPKPPSGKNPTGLPPIPGLKLDPPATPPPVVVPPPPATPPPATPPPATPPPAAAPPTVQDYVIQSEDYGASFLAKRISPRGANSWHELEPINPSMKVVQSTLADGSPVTYFAPWNVGQHIAIPADWTP